MNSSVNRRRARRPAFFDPILDIVSALRKMSTKADQAQAAENLKKHGVAFDEALTVFADPLAKIFDDPDHSETERREVIIGHSANQRLLIVTFTERLPKTRIIGAPEATQFGATGL